VIVYCQVEENIIPRKGERPYLVDRKSLQSDDEERLKENDKKTTKVKKKRPIL